jgi:zinc protease
MTVFGGTTHIDNLGAYYKLVREMLLDPGFRQDDFARLKDEALNFLKTSLREENDEELGKEALYLNIYGPAHPYGHHNAGRVSALESMTLQDVKDFYAAHYTQANLVIGLAGGFPAGFSAQVKGDFAKLPAGDAAKRARIPPPELAPGLKIDIIQRETRSTAISLGFPISVTRSDPDWPALALATSYFGQHRSSNSYLYRRLREVRGLNYGDYAYIEYFPRGMFQFQPDPNQGRQQQIFQIWIRPVEVKDGHFALRAALYEYDKLIRDGISPEAFASTRDFLSKNVNLLVANQDAQLGYLLDSRYYNISEFTKYMRQSLAKLTLEQVNAALRKHLKTDRMRVVLVTKDANALRDAIVGNKPSPITYNTAKPQDVLNEDKIIQDYPITVSPNDVAITPVARVFQ